MSAPGLSNATSTAYTDVILSSQTESPSGWRSKARQSAWHAKVYKANPTDSVELLLQFREVTKRIFKRDRYQCQACFITRIKLERLGRYLTCHHINPRSEGGSLLDENLITLCNQCHNYVEEKTYRSRGEITGCQAPDQRHYRVNRAPDLDWHKWVYGGWRRPER